MDRYVLARTRDLVATVTAQLDAYDIAAACESVREHLDVLTNWYVRTQRDRFWAEDADAFDTLWTALEVLTRVMAPLAPLVTEEVWRGLTGGRSVHLTDWPEVRPRRPSRRRARRRDGPGPRGRLDRARPAQGRGLRVRQPLRSLTVAVADADALAPYADLLAAELNVKRVDLVDGRRGHGRALRHHAAPRGQRPRGGPAAGPRRAGGHQGRTRRGLAAWTATRSWSPPTTATWRSSRASTS